MRTSYPSSFTSLVSGKAVGGIVYDDFSPYRGPTVSQCKAEIIFNSFCSVRRKRHLPQPYRIFLNIQL